MALTRLLAAVLAAGQIASGYLVAPAGTAFPGASSECSAWVYGTASLTCTEIESEYGITLTQFATWNPDLFEISATCAIISGYYYCIQIDFENTVTTTSSSSISTSTTFVTSAATTVTGSTSTEWGDGLSTPSPIQTGMTDICYEYHLVVSGDTCAVIASNAGIALSDFEAWNPAVGTSCTDLDIGDYVCIRILGYGYSSATPTPTSSSSRLAVTTTPTSTGDGVSTPSPIQTGMVSTCDSFYLVVSGDSCAVIAENADISLTDFYSWNPAVGLSCAYLGLGDYVCIGVIGSTATTTTIATATTTSSGITTPSPVQTGMVSDCDAFYYVVDGDGCSSIATAEGASVADLELWNPAIGTDCTDLWLDTYICVGVL